MLISEVFETVIQSSVNYYSPEIFLGDFILKDPMFLQRLQYGRDVPVSVWSLFIFLNYSGKEELMSL